MKKCYECHKEQKDTSAPELECKACTHPICIKCAFVGTRTVEGGIFMEAICKSCVDHCVKITNRN